MNKLTKIKNSPFNFIFLVIVIILLLCIKNILIFTIGDTTFPAYTSKNMVNSEIKPNEFNFYFHPKYRFLYNGKFYTGSTLYEINTSKNQIVDLRVCYLPFLPEINSLGTTTILELIYNDENIFLKDSSRLIKKLIFTVAITLFLIFLLRLLIIEIF